MYLARHIIRGRPRYYIRESYFDGACFRSRTLFDLAEDPEQYIVYPGGNAYYIDERVEDELRRQGVENASDRLEEVFWPFLDPHIRHVIEGFSRKRSKRGRQLDSHADAAPDDFHAFDKRRVHFLRFGRMDQGHIGRMPAKLMANLKNRSRDELEQYFIRSESILRPHEIKNYVFVIFDLQRHFTRLAARTTPQILEAEKLDEYFISDVCRLNRDEKFWFGHKRNTVLNEYLVRYAVMFFDYEFGESTILQDTIRKFMDDRRRFRFYPARQTMGLDEASARFKVEKSVLRKMTRREITVQYRRLALKLHPDKGGDAGQFIKLTEAYKALIRNRT